MSSWPVSQIRQNPQRIGSGWPVTQTQTQTRWRKRMGSGRPASQTRRRGEGLPIAWRQLSS